MRCFAQGPIWTVEFNRHGTLMATGGEDGKVMLWKVHAPGEGRHRDDHHEGNYRNEDEDEEDEKRNGQGDGEGDGDGTQPSREERSRERMDEELGESLEENVKEKEKHQESGDESGSRVSSSADQTGSESASSASALSDEVQSLGRGDSYLGASDESKGEGKEKEKGKGSGGRMFGRFKVRAVPCPASPRPARVESFIMIFAFAMPPPLQACPCAGVEGWRTDRQGRDLLSTCSGSAVEDTVVVVIYVGLHHSS